MELLRFYHGASLSERSRECIVPAVEVGPLSRPLQAVITGRETR